MIWRMMVVVVSLLVVSGIVYWYGQAPEMEKIMIRATAV